jgi:hypothetical protein
MILFFKKIGYYDGRIVNASREIKEINDNVHAFNFCSKTSETFLFVILVFLAVCIRNAVRAMLCYKGKV